MVNISFTGNSQERTGIKYDLPDSFALKGDIGTQSPSASPILAFQPQRGHLLLESGVSLLLLLEAPRRICPFSSTFLALPFLVKVPTGRPYFQVLSAGEHRIFVRRPCKLRPSSLLVLGEQGEVRGQEKACKACESQGVRPLAIRLGQASM